MSAKSFADSTPLQQPPRSQPREWRRPLAFATLLFFVWTWNLTDWFHARNAVLHSTPHPVYTDWHDIPTSEKLDWVRCALFGMTPDGYLCARLTVPMDYQRPHSPAKVHIALVLLPAPGHGLETGRFSESPLLINPGGPGGSGTTFTFPPFGPTVQAAAGGDLDLLGFDPRGIGATVPPADCFITSDDSPGAESVARLHRATWRLMAHDIGLPNTTDGATEAIAQRARAVSKLCQGKDDEDAGEQAGLKYMATPNVAADMRTIIEAHDDWLKENGFETVVLGAATRTPSETPPPSTKRKLVYWGFSYGTLLGQTFAAMYPDSVGRLVLDGVVDSGVYDRPSWWMASMRDADQILEKFFYFCHLAGDKCALFRAGDDGLDAIKGRYEQIMARLRDDPFIIVSPGASIPVILTESDIKATMFATLYSPMRTFPVAARLLDALYTETSVADFVIPPDLGPVCWAGFRMPFDPLESPAAIGCSDQRYKRNETLDEIYNKLSHYTAFGDVFLTLMMHCEGWTIEAKFPSPDWDANLESPDPVNTSFPILFAGNTHDPVTPLGAAVEMSRRFVDAGVFELEAEGHTTLAAVSLCAIGKIRDYLHKGIVPPQPAGGALSGWDKCKSDERPWKPFLMGDGTFLAEEVQILRSFEGVQAQIVGPLVPSSKLRVHTVSSTWNY